MARHLDIGVWGERQAELELRRKRYRILGRRVRIGRHDEVDLIARDDTALVFVEVKTRAREEFGRPVAAVDRDKRHNLSRAAVRYLKKLKRPPAYLRFDVIEVIGTVEGSQPLIRHIENAFSLDPCYVLPY